MVCPNVHEGGIAVDARPVYPVLLSQDGVKDSLVGTVHEAEALRNPSLRVPLDTDLANFPELVEMVLQIVLLYRAWNLANKNTVLVG